MAAFILTEKVTYALGWVVLHSLWQAVLIAIFSGTMLIVFRKKSSKVKYWITNLSLFSVLMSAIITFFIYTNFYQQAMDLSFTPVDYSSSNISKVVHDVNCVPTEEQPTISNNINSLSWNGFKDYINSNIYLIVTFWLLGVSVFLIKLLGGISYIYYLKSKMNFPPDEYWIELLESLKNKAGIKKSIDLVESAMVRTPIVVGYLKPMILFPIGAINRLEAGEVEAILAHELAHVLRNDYFFNILQNIVEALFYYHPAVWWMSAQIRVERENCCDDKAIELCGNSMIYAKSLVRVQEMAYYSPSLAMSFSGNKKGQLLNRVQRILKQPQNRNNIVEKLIATCLLLFFVIALSIGGSFEGKNENLFAQNTDNSEAVSTNKKAKNYLKYEQVSGFLDSLPINSDIKDGVYDISDPLHMLHLVVKDKSVVAFNLNGLDVPASKIRDFEKLIVKAFAKKKEFDEKPFTESKLTIADNQNESQLASLTSSTDNNSENITSSTKSTWSTSFSNDDDGNGAHIGKNTNLVLTNSDGFRFNFVQNGKGEFIYVSKKDKILGTVEIRSNRFLINGKEASANQLKEFGLKISGKGLNPINGSFTTEENKGEITSNDESDFDFNNDEYQDQIQNVQEKINCYSNKGYDKRKLEKLQNDLNKLSALLDKKVDDNRFQNQIENIEESLNNLCYDKGEKGEKGEKNNYYFYNNGGNDSNLKTLVYNELMKDGLLKKGVTYVSINNFNMMVNNEVITNSKLEKYKKLCEKATGMPFDKTSYFTLSYNNDEEGASIGKRTSAFNNNEDEEAGTKEENSKVFTTLINMMNRDGFISINKKTKIFIDNNRVTLNGKSLDYEKTQKYCNEIAHLVKKNSRFSVYFDGKIQKIEKNGIQLIGRLDQSFSD